MFFSVLIPNLGFHQFLKPCIESIVNQKTNNLFSFEIILCDQSDINDFEKISCFLKEFSFRNLQISLMHQDEKNVLVARHNLLKKARGEYIVFIDSDDYVDNSYLLKIYYFLTQNKYPDILLHNFCYVFSDKMVEQSMPHDLKEHVMDYFLFTDLINPVCNKAFKRALYDFDEYKVFNVANGDDWVLLLPVMKKATNIFIANSCLGYYYRQNANSITHKVSFNVAMTSIQYRFDFLSPLKLNRYQDSLFTKYKIGLFSHLLSSLFISRTPNKLIKEFIVASFNYYFEKMPSFDTSLLTKRENFIFSLLNRNRVHLLFLLFKINYIRRKKKYF